MAHFYYSLGTFGIMGFLGEVYPGLIGNALCFPVLGCNLGFFGYDGLVHFVSGTCIGLGLLWFKRHEVWQFIFWAAGIALAWEAMEWAYDTTRSAVLHTDLLYPINIMTQPSPIDTAGDLALGCLGTALVYAVYRWRRNS